MAMSATHNEPRTLEEMQARYRAAQERNAAAARRLAEHKRQQALAVDAKPQPVAERRRPGRIVTAPEVRLAAMLPPECDEVHPKRIIARIAAEHGVTSAAITGHCHTKKLAAARHAAIAAVEAAHPGLSLSQIGRFFGDRHHTTILYALRKMDAQRAADPADDEASAQAARELLCEAPDPEAILDLVASAYGTTVRHLRGSSRSKRLMAPRRVAIVAIKAAHPTLSSLAIGRIINREHSSVIRALKMHEQRRAASSALPRSEEGSR